MSWQRFGFAKVISFFFVTLILRANKKRPLLSSIVKCCKWFVPAHKGHKVNCSNMVWFDCDRSEKQSTYEGLAAERTKMNILARPGNFKNAQMQVRECLFDDTDGEKSSLICSLKVSETGKQTCFRKKKTFSALRLAFLLLAFGLGEHLCLRSSRVYGFTFCKHNETRVKLVDNGFEKISVWIGPEVPEEFELIAKLQELFTSTSSTLYRLTKNRAYFRHIEVILPHTWGTLPDGLADQISNATVTVNSQTQALFRLRNSHPRFSQESQTSWRLGDKYAYINKPYVIKTTPCGFSGSYVRLPPEFVMFGDQVIGDFGPPDKVVASEFAKLRWGVYDEKPRATAESDFYLHSNLQVRPTICSSAIPGKVVNVSDPATSCSVDESLYEKKCRFQPTLEKQSKSYASVMYRSDLPHVNEFCDDEVGVAEELKHDDEAPTIQNLHCRGRSVWSVMRNHPDFADGNNPSPLVEKSTATIQVEPPPPKFTIVQNLDRRVVLILDVSTSMGMYNKLELMRQAASHYINTVPINYWVGIVCFAAKAQIKAPLTVIRTEDGRNLLKERLEFLQTVTGTSIARGLEEGLKVLMTSGPKILRGAGGTMIVLTDGLEHNKPKINETVLQRVKEFGVRVNTIAFGSKVSRELEHLAEVSGGHSHAASSGEFGIDSELIEAFLSHHEVVDVGAVALVSKEVLIKSNSSKEETFVIDDSVGRNTRISVFYKSETLPEVMLESPTGDVFDDQESTDDVIFSHDSRFKTMTIRIPGSAQVGIWKVIFQNNMQTSRMSVRLNVMSYPNSEEPLVISPALLCRSFDFTGTESMVIYVYVSKGELAVLGANVAAEITRPLAVSGIVDTRFVILQDNGLDPDVTRDDGVYSAYFISFTMKGRYNVKVYVDDNNQQASIDPMYMLGIGLWDQQPISHDTRYLLPTLQPSQGSNTNARKRRALQRLTLQPFQRVSSAAGAFNVRQWNVDNTCTPGYTHFQDACYKIIGAPRLEFEMAQSYCVSDGGQLAVLNSRQELSWLLARITPQNDPSSGNAWFGGVDEQLRANEELDIEQIVQRVRRGMADEDLNALTSLFNKTNLSGDLLYAADSFDPDLQGLTARDINRIINKLGIKTRKDLIIELRAYATSLRKQLRSNTVFSGVKSRKRRQLSPGSFDLQGLLALGLGPPPNAISTATPLKKTQSPVTGTEPITNPSNITETYTDTVTLSPAKREPEIPDPQSSGADIPTCSWFQSGKLIESTGDVCQTLRKFVCEKPVRDRFPPSRIVDLRGRVDTKDKLLSLRWSAPGDDLDMGRAEGYDVRILRTRIARHVLAFNFEKGVKVPDDAIVTGNLRSPRSAGDTERMVVNLTQNMICPPHGAIDLIFAAPPEAFEVQSPNEPVTSAVEDVRNALVQFISDVVGNFTLDEFEMQISVIAHTVNIPVLTFANKLSLDEILKAIRSTSLTVPSPTSSIDDVVNKMQGKGGRSDASKVLIVVTDKVGDFVNVTGVKKLIVSTSQTVNKTLLWETAFAPGCRNSFIVDGIKELSAIAADVQNQLCKARINEFQAVGVSAFDDVGHRGDPSNIIPFVMSNDPESITCPVIEKIPEPALAQSNIGQTVGLAVGLPITVILSIVGTVMLFGQVKKWKKKRQQQKEKKEQQERMEKARAARAGAVQAATTQAASSSQGDPNINNNAIRKAWYSKNQTAPLSYPPV